MKGYVQLINRENDLLCCAEADSAAATQTIVATQKPDLLVLDLRLKDGHALELIKLLHAQVPALLILVLSQHDETLYAERALRAGARGYLMKQEATDEVRSAIRTILKGEMYVSRKMSVIALNRLLGAKAGSGGANLESLSDRELQVFQLLGASRSTRQIAEELHINFKTVETYRGRAMNAWQAGADGVYLFNFFDPLSPLWRELGDPALLRTRARNYFASVRGIGSMPVPHQKFIRAYRPTSGSSCPRRLSGVFILDTLLKLAHQILQPQAQFLEPFVHLGGAGLDALALRSGVKRRRDAGTLLRLALFGFPVFFL